MIDQRHRADNSRRDGAASEKSLQDQNPRQPRGDGGLISQDKI